MSSSATDVGSTSTPADIGSTSVPTDFAFEQLEPSAPPPRDTHAQILARAASEGERIVERARAKGYEEGHAQGLADGQAEAQAAAQALREALAGTHELRCQTVEEVEQDAVELALALAAKIVAGTLQAQPEQVLECVRGALRRVSDRRHVTLLVDPDDLEIVSGALSELSAETGLARCDVQADRRIGRGGALVRTSEGEIDATVETQLQRARELMLTGLRAHEGGATRVARRPEADEPGPSSCQSSEGRRAGPLVHQSSSEER